MTILPDTYFEFIVGEAIMKSSITIPTNPDQTTREPLAKYDYDIAVIGSGSGGLSAAIAAARNGARVMLIDRHGYLGGTIPIRFLPYPYNRIC